MGKRCSSPVIQTPYLMRIFLRLRELISIEIEKGLTKKAMKSVIFRQIVPSQIQTSAHQISLLAGLKHLKRPFPLQNQKQHILPHYRPFSPYFKFHFISNQLCIKILAFEYENQLV